MIPVKQTNFDRGTGDCWSACIASILEIPLADVPNFCHQDLGPLWLKRTVDWLQARNVGVVHIQDAAKAIQNYPHLCVGCYCIITGQSPRAKEGETDFLHAIVASCHLVETPEGYVTRFDFAHDPHPSEDFIVGVPLDITFLIPMPPYKGIA